MRQRLIPAVALLLMAWWIDVFFILMLPFHSMGQYFSSYIPFFLAFAVFSFFAFVLMMAEWFFGIWSRSGHWVRAGVLVGTYTAAILITMTLEIDLFGEGYVDYFGGDPEGSFGMLYIPSIAFYVLLALGVCATIALVRRLSERER